MKNHTGHAIVRSFALLNWLFAALLVLASLALLLAGPSLQEVIAPDAPLFGEAVNGAGLAAASVLLALAALYLLAGTGLWMRKRWARTLAIALAVVSMLAFPFGTAIGLLGVWLLGFNNKVIGLFKPARS